MRGKNPRAFVSSLAEELMPQVLMELMKPRWISFVLQISCAVVVGCRGGGLLEGRNREAVCPGA